MGGAGPKHGPLDCTLCFERGRRTVTANGWTLVNDPSYFGSSDPRILVLGQSKGRNQSRVDANVDFDSVAFAGMRRRLGLVLTSIGVPVCLDDMDRHFRATEPDLAFASLLRCALTDARGMSSGSPIVEAMRDERADFWIRSCIARWLSAVNPRLRLVVLLGRAKPYVDRVLTRLSRQFETSFQRTHSHAAEANGVVWVFCQHPSTAAGNHFKAWIGRDPLEVRDQVNGAVRKALADR